MLFPGDIRRKHGECQAKILILSSLSDKIRVKGNFMMNSRKWLIRAKHVLVVAMCLHIAGCGDGNKSDRKLDSFLRTGQEEMEKGRYRQAIASFEKASRLDPNAPEPYIRLALIYQECLHEPATALRYYRKYQEVEKDAVKKEEVRGWIVQLERTVGEGTDTDRGAMPPAERVPAREGNGAASKGEVSPRPSVAASSVPLEESPAYKNLQAKLASALQEIRQLKAQRTPDSNPPEKHVETQQRVKVLESEKELLTKNLREARVNALRSQQALLQAQKTSRELRRVYESQIADFKKRLNVAEAKLRDFQATGKGAPTARMLKELRDARRQRDVAKAEHFAAAEEIARLKKTLRIYTATLSSLQKLNDELRKENASLRPPSVARSGRVRRHVVREGETLKKIAGYSSVYGDSELWVLIYQANKDKVRNPNKLTPGTVLVIPPG